MSISAPHTRHTHYSNVYQGNVAATSPLSKGVFDFMQRRRRQQTAAAGCLEAENAIGYFKSAGLQVTPALSLMPRRQVAAITPIGNQ